MYKDADIVIPSAKKRTLEVFVEFLYNYDFPSLKFPLESADAVYGARN